MIFTTFHAEVNKTEAASVIGVFPSSHESPASVIRPSKSRGITLLAFLGASPKARRGTFCGCV
jgi:hypothetical protein